MPDDQPTAHDQPVGSAASDQGARWGAQLGGALGTALGEAASRSGQVTRAVLEGYGTARDRAGAVDPGAQVRHLGDVLEGVVEDGLARVRRPAPRRTHWRWAGAAALAGAVAGAGVAVGLRRVLGQDAPGAQDPDQLRAVVDLAVVRDAATAPTRPATA